MWTICNSPDEISTLSCNEFSDRSKLDILLKRYYHLVCLSHYLERIRLGHLGTRFNEHLCHMRQR